MTGLKRSLIILSVAFLAVMFSGLAMAATTGTLVDSGVKANVVTAPTLALVTSLNFGKFMASTSIGTINTSGAVSGGVLAINDGTRANGQFTITAQEATSFTISQLAEVKLTDGTSSHDMIATVVIATTDLIGSITAGTTKTVSLVKTTGGSDLPTLAIAANQTSGTYTGSYTVTVNYN